MPKSRRKFLKAIAPSIMGAAVVPNVLWSQSTDQLRAALKTLDSIDETEEYWETIQSQFNFADDVAV